MPMVRLFTDANVQRMERPRWISRRYCVREKIQKGEKRREEALMVVPAAAPWSSEIDLSLARWTPPGSSFCAVRVWPRSPDCFLAGRPCSHRPTRPWRFSTCRETKMSSSTWAPLADLKNGPLAQRAVAATSLTGPAGPPGHESLTRRTVEDRGGMVWKTVLPVSPRGQWRLREAENQREKPCPWINNYRHTGTTPTLLHMKRPWAGGLSCSSPAVDPRPRIEQDQMAGIIGQTDRPPSFISRAKV